MVMSVPRRLLVFAVSLIARGVLALSQAQSLTAAAPSGPTIDKIDPPGWFVGLPDPMLPVHGQGLQQAQFAVQSEGVKLIRTQASTNGHWTFLWIETGSAVAQTLRITAANSQGRSQKPFALADRSSDPNAHRSFSSADALYLVMTDRFAQGDQAAKQPGGNRAAERGWHGGNFAGIEQHLDYLQQLGVNTLWTTPVASNGDMPEFSHGYAATHLYAVDKHFGTIENHLETKHDFDQLVDPHAPGRDRQAITEG
jgi:hypothetical protein